MKIIKLLFVLLPMTVLLASCSYSGDNTHKNEVALFYKNNDDGFAADVRGELDSRFDESGVRYTNYYSSGQKEQTEQIEKAVRSGAKLIVVDLYDGNSEKATERITEACDEKDVPLIFFNTPIDETVANDYDEAVFVGAEKTMRDNVSADALGTAHTILRVIDNFVNKRSKMSGIDDDYITDGYKVTVPELQIDNESEPVAVGEKTDNNLPEKTFDNVNTSSPDKKRK